MPEICRVVVAVDPAASSNEDSDECGIVVAALGTDGHGYILADLSGKMLPEQWASKAIAAYHKYDADRIIAEQNMGGAMVESVIRAVDRNVSYRGLTAKRGKMLRAEPISALYERGMVHHVGSFQHLEDQMTSYDGSGDSPDRLDALVYGCTELLSAKKSTGMISYYRQMCEEADTTGGLPPLPQIEATTVHMLAPDGISTAFLLSGRRVDIGEDRQIQVSERDASPLRAAGWKELEIEHV